MKIKRTCLSAACVVALCFMTPLGLDFYNAHSHGINKLAALSALLTTGEYSEPKPVSDAEEIKEEIIDEKILPPETEQLAVDRTNILRILESTKTNQKQGSHRVLTEQPSDESLAMVKYPNSLERHDGVIQNYTYPAYKGTQYIDLPEGGQVRNCTELSNDVLKKQLAKDLPFKISLDSDQPQVLIYHTHTTESYEPYARDFYDSTFSSKTTEMDKNVVSVGDRICRELDKAGITYVHDTLIHDHPDYNGAYDSSRKTVKEILKKYPSIKVCLDIHRDGIQRGDGTRIAPVTEIDGKQAAQIMIISGCDDGTMGMPNCLENFIFASKLQSQIEGDHKTLTRPVLFDYRHYNQDLTTGSLLIEMGSHGNSIEQAQYSGELVGRSLVKLLKKQ